MELLEGGTLQDRLDGCADRVELLDLLLTATRGVVALHLAGVVHRDLKPANILLDASGCPRVSDLGLARDPGASTGLTGSGDCLGTPAYMAPEQIEGRRDVIGPESDVYALGVQLFRILTGRLPFIAETLHTLVRRILTGQVPAPSRVEPSVPPAYDRVCLRAMARFPGERYSTARAFGQALAEAGGLPWED
jgi:serine/threonine-protein kinase